MAIDAYSGFSSETHPEIKNVYDAGFKIAELYIEKHKAGAIKDAIESDKFHILVELEMPEDAREIYRHIEMHNLRGAVDGFCKGLVEHYVMLSDVEQIQRRRATLKFNADWNKVNIDVVYSQISRN